MLTATALVMLMSLPGLTIFYGRPAMVFTAYATSSVVWVIYGYSLAFGTDIGGVIGSPEKLFLSGVDAKSLQGTIPELLFVAFQGTFAAICCPHKRFLHRENEVFCMATF